MQFGRTVAAYLLLAAFAAAADSAPPPTPKILDARLKLELILADPEIATPTGIAARENGTVLVVENNTHFRLKDYPRAPHDRILAIKDTDGDGKPDKTSVFFEGARNTMNLAVHFNGGIFVATRSEIFVLTDQNDDGRADQSFDDRKILIRLDTKGDYPHNGLSGFAFDILGNVYFGIGENLGADYKLIGTDGHTFTGGGEGGNIYSCREDGGGLWRMATGFWNPFHLGFDRFGRLFAVDNDPDSRPPCRLLHIVPGGDYGFKFRNGRKGVHPFTSWNGELPGTLPMVAGTGEAPCAVLAYESDQLPEEYRGELLVTSWGDHRLERYRLKPRGVSFSAEMKPLIVGDENFRPVGLAMAPDGSLYMSDWVDKSYQLHGKGRVWRLSAKETPKLDRDPIPANGLESPHGPWREAAARAMSEADLNNRATHARRPEARSLAARMEFGKQRSNPHPPVGPELFRDLGNIDETARKIKTVSDLSDPFQLVAAAGRISLSSESKSVRERMIRDFADNITKAPRTALIEMIAAQDRNVYPEFIPLAFSSTDIDLQSRAVVWIGESRHSAHRPALEELLSRTTNRRVFELTLAALDMLDLKPGQKVNETAGSDYVLKLLQESKSTPEILRLCLRMIPARHPKLTDDLLAKLLAHDDSSVRIEAIRTWRERGDSAVETLKTIAGDAKRDDAERAEAVIGLSVDPEKHRSSLAALDQDAPAVVQKEAARALRPLGEKPSTDLPPPNDAAAWLKRLDGTGDPAAGERLFFHPRFANCYRCHEHQGRGAEIGPDLTAIGGTFSNEKLLQSLLEPSREISPRYAPWLIELADGRVITGLYTGEETDGTLLLADPAGKILRVHPRDIVERKAAEKSIMPEGLLESLTAQEIRDLFAFLRKPTATSDRP